METKEFGDGARSLDFVGAGVDEPGTVVGGSTNVATSLDNELGVATDVPLDGKDEEGVIGTTTLLFSFLVNGTLPIGVVTDVPLDGKDDEGVAMVLEVVAVASD